MKVEDLQNDLAKELVNTSQDIIIDIVEIGLDSILTDGIVKEIPVVKTLATFFNIGLNIKDRYFAEKLIKFILELRNEQIDEEKRLEFKSDMEIESFKKKTTERLIIILDKLEEINKTIYITKLFKGFIEKKITWDEFRDFSKYIDFMTTKDFELLKFLSNFVHDDIIDGECLSISEKKELEGNANKLMQFNFVQIKILGSSAFGTVAITIIHSLTKDGVKFLSCIN